MKKLAQIFALSLMMTCMIFSSISAKEMPKEEISVVSVEISQLPIISTEIITTIETKVLVREPQISDADIQLIALITMAEAEGECEEGKRLVIDTILNRVDSSSFPDTIYDVIYQPNQFSCIWNGRVDRVSATEETCQLVREECLSRTNDQTLFFTAGDYGKYGTPMFSIGGHYFSS